jgi:hypothetical protein
MDDRLVRAVEQPLAVHRHLEPHSFFDLVVPSDRPLQIPVRILRVDLREEAERPGIDSEHLRVGELQRA